jgi:hypothetical protein
VDQHGRVAGREGGDPDSSARVGETAEARLIREAGPEAIARAQQMAEWSQREAGFVAAHGEVFAAALGGGLE